MKRRFTFLLAAVILLMSGLAWGQTRTQINWVAADQGYTNGQLIETVDFDDNVEGAFYKGANNSNAPKYYNTGSAIRCYGGNFFTIATSAGNLTEIVLSFSSGEGTNAITTDVGTYENGTWTGSASSVTFTIGGTTGHRRIAVFDITYSSGGQQTVATPTFSPAGGTYTEAQQVTINCSTQGATIYYTLDGNAPTTSSAVYSSPIAISQTTTVKAMATKAGMNNSSVATATYTIQEAPSVITIAEAKALAVNEYALVQGVVTFIDGRNVYIQDETAGIDLFLNSAVSTLALGDKVQAYGKRANYSGLIELTGINPTDASQFSVISTGNPLPLAVKTIAEILADHQSGDALQSTRVKIVEATVGTINNNNNTPISQGESSINIYKMPVVEGLVQGDIATVIGVIGCFSNNAQLRVASADDITFTHPQQETVATPTFSPAGGTYTEAQNVTIACTTQGATIHYTLDGTDPTVNSTTYANPIAISQTTTVKAFAVKNGMTNSAIATATYTIAEGPSLITIAEARALENNQYALVQGIVTFIDGRNVYAQDATGGIDLYLNTNTVPESLALGDKVQAYGKKTAFHGLVELTGINGGNASEFSIVSTGNTLPLAVKTIAEILADHQNGDALQSTRVKVVEATVGTINNNNNTPISQGENTINIYKMPVVEGLVEGDIATVIAIIGCYDNAQLRVANAADITFTHPQQETVATPTFSPAAGTYTEAQNVTIACSTEGATIHYTLDGTDPTVNSATYTSAIAINETTTVKAFAVKEGMNNSVIATAEYIISITPPAQETAYTLITDANALVAGDKYIIVGIKGDTYKALGKQAANNRPSEDVTPVDNVITLVPATTNLGGVFELTLGQADDLWTLYDAVNEGYLYAASSSANQLKVQAENNANGQWTIEIASDGVATIKAQGENTRNWIRLNNSGTPFSCYGSGQLDVYLYKAGDVPPPPQPTYYTVSVAEGITNGTVTVDKTTAQAGETVTVTANPVSGYMLATLTYTYGETSNNINQQTMQFNMPAGNVVVNATFAETQPDPITIAEARALDLNQYALVQGVVTFIDGRNVYVQDATAGIDLFLNTNTVPEALAIGDMVKAYGKTALYKGLLELSGINGGNTSEFSIISSGNTLPLAEKTIAEINEDAAGSNMLQSTRVKIVEATVGTINPNNNTPISQGENTLNIYKMPVVEGLVEGDNITVIGVIGCFNTPQLRVNSATDVTVIQPEVPTITLNPTSLSGFTYVYEEGPSNVKTFVISGNNLSATTHIVAPESYELSSLPGENFYPENHITINTYTGDFHYTIKVRMKAGLEVGNYQESITIYEDEVDTMYIALSGNVSGQPQPGSGYVRISDVSQLTNGAQVIIAARFDENANNYYAMTAQTTGKPEGVPFTSVMDGGNETLPAAITDEESTFYWTVTTDGSSYTFTNANGDVLGYTSSTNFSTGGDNTAWAITYMTSEATAMVPEYSGFVVNNVNTPVRAIALNSNHNYGPYHTQNMNAENYNFYLDMFATTGGGTMTCATPFFTPEGGTYYEAQEVAISCNTADATIYYTLDGSDPTDESDVYSAPIPVATSMTIKAIAMKEGYENSNIATAEYTIIIGAVTIFNQDWEGDMNGWTFVSVEGNKPWNISQYNNNHYAYANGYNGGVNEQWCISPAFDLNAISDASLTFMNAKNYIGPDLQLFFSNNYDGETPGSASWTELEFNKSTGSYTWTESGVIDLSDFSGDECYIGFKYTSTEDQAAAWEIDDIVLMGFTTDPYLTVTPNALSGFTYIVGNGPSQAQTFTVSGGNLPPAPGGSSGGITITCSNSHYEFSLDGEEYWHNISIEVVGTLEPTPVYVRLEEGLYVGQWDGVVTLEDGGTTATVTVSGTVIDQPQVNDWNRIYALSDLHDGDQVILAARYDATIGDGYYAMTAGVSGKPDGVLFTSVNQNGAEMLPTEIAAEADTYLWNVTLNGDVITLVNAAGDSLGYSSSTNFAGNVNTEWNIALETSEEGALIPNYTGFVITNGTTTNRGIAKNASNKFGAYATSNMSNPDYNFYLDLFVMGGSVTPTVATPVFSVASGTYYEEFDVEIVCATEGATIYFTTDGTDPSASSEVYTEPIHVIDDMTLKAIAMKEGYDNSGIATANYVVNTGLIVIFDQDWEGEMNGWTFVTVEGNKPWTIGTYAGNHYANANGYNDDVDNEQWCISPAFNLNNYEGVTLTFRNAMKFTGPDLELYFTNDYDGQDPTAASWEPLEFTMSEGNYTWTESGEISLDGFNGSMCNIGFRYISTLADGAAAWEIDDILLSATNITGVSEAEMMHVNLWNHDNQIVVENHTDSNLQMVVFDLLGQQVLAKAVGTGTVRFSHNLTQGLYIVILQNSKERMAGKIIVK